MGLVIAGERSGVGKTTVTLALLAALREQGRRVQSFKVGPDYIDPMFHRQVTNRPCYNLDPVLTSEAYVRWVYGEHTRDRPYALIEGVMGLFDGATGVTDWASTAHIARLLELPVLLVLDASRLAGSVAALAHGYRSLDPGLKMAGVVLNRVGSERHLALLRAALDRISMPILGVLRRQDDITIPDRHLGLVPTDELPQLRQILQRLAVLGQQCFAWQQLEPWWRQPPREIPEAPLDNLPQPLASARIAVAWDRAFSFYYPDNLALLQQAGAEVVYWSPLQDQTLPDDIQGLYFGGGFPEVFAEELSHNCRLRQQVQEAVARGLPTYGECGGLMYLCDRIIDFDGRRWPMVGVLPTTVQMGTRLTLGYRQATALQDSLLLPQGVQVWGHEFHRSQLLQSPEAPLYRLRRYDATTSLGNEGWHRGHLQASYVHLHWGGCPEMVTRFVHTCGARSL
ncbi:Cobyrinate a,c-diamide synthase [Halomicronema hongdechloris C2206]|uniref:Cobyrinate a,c-diamide synthase n=1 Tax=Halomicronema hongdechloris C2206 TaxID=1641165 RepID=A0A1Z3HI30_9CYAN|nr:cobyrinate a,c-diamide synthase [Halomicronema hongdechloris]ASC69933.1 Cobyrinate a,c-diamide synthase [Halomicronema hongdechloris C2206]